MAAGQEAISLGYEAGGLASPLGVHTHSTRAVASSQALFKDSSLEDICAEAGWTSPSTFIKFYILVVSRCFPRSSSYLQVREGVMVYRSHSNRYRSVEVNL